MADWSVVLLDIPTYVHVMDCATTHGAQVDVWLNPISQKRKFHVGVAKILKENTWPSSRIC
jgi:hypothetical protein